MNRIWLIVICSFLLLTLSVALRGRKSGRCALYLIALKAQYAICFAAALLPTLATVIEEIPERFIYAWRRERGEFEVVRRMKSA